jgi:signal transduction histidine kinase
MESGAIVENCRMAPDINADSVQMVQLFQNLIDNALYSSGRLSRL